jgi:hypothetical protein
MKATTPDFDVMEADTIELARAAYYKSCQENKGEKCFEQALAFKNTLKHIFGQIK